MSRFLFINGVAFDEKTRIYFYKQKTSRDIDNVYRSGRYQLYCHTVWDNIELLLGWTDTGEIWCCRSNCKYLFDCRNGTGNLWL